MVDIVLITAPFTITSQPLAAPAVLKSILSEKYTSAFIDLNAELNRSSNDILKNYFLYGTISPGWASAMASYITTCANRIAEHNPSWLAISIFTMFGQRFTDLLVRYMKHQYPNIKIILGGQGLSVNGINSQLNIGEDLRSHSLIDSWVKSEAETQLLTAISSAHTPSKQWTQVEDLNSLSYPCYDDYDFTLYDSPTIPITGSRGCVRRCTFCDIHQHWKKFVFRSGENIVSEIKHQVQKTGIKNFIFTDSLVNGSMKAYRDFVKMLADENLGVTWSGQFIIRPQNQMTEEDWRLTKLSGGHRLAVGVESLVERIRDEMGKKFSNDDIMFAVKQARKNNILLSFLMLVGYVSETEDDHREQLEIFKQLAEYKDVIVVSLGTTLGTLPGTPIYDNAEKYGIILGDTENNWINPTTGSTYEVRMRRRLELENHVYQLGFRPAHNLDSLQHTMMDYWNEN